MDIDSLFFEYSTRNGDSPESICPTCIITPPDPEKDYGKCPVCLCHAYDFNEINSTIFINNIDNILLNLDDDAISSILSCFKRAIYSCYECSSLSDDDYFCTTCENNEITEIDYILFKLKENNKDSAINRLTSIIDNLM